MVASQWRPSPGRATRAASSLPGVGLAALVASVGCFSEPSSVDPKGTDGSTTGSAAATAGSSSGTSTGPADSTGSADATGPGSTGSVDAESSSSGVGSSSTGACGAREPALMWAEDATLVPPMELETAVLLPGTPQLARSYAGDAGSIVFDFDLPCAAAIEIHALVWDAVSGVALDGDPDSYFVSVDDGRETVWTYGCETGGVRDGTWLWQRAGGSTREQCDEEKLVFELDPGPHELRLRNRESGGDLVYAAIAAVVITDDPGFDPATLYEPTG